MSNGTLLGSDSRPRAHTRPAGSSFGTLVAVELRRFWWRRLTKVAIVGIIAFVGIASYAIYQETSPEVVAQRLEDYQAMAADMKRQQDSVSAEDRASQIEQCQRDEATQKQVEPNTDFNCEQAFAPPSLEDFGLVNQARSELIRQLAQTSVYLVGFLAFLLGASFVAAEFSSGSMGNWLTFQPRRIRVAAAKLTASTIGGAGLAVAAVGLSALAVTGITTINRPDGSLQLPEGPTSGESLTLGLVRVIAVIALGGLGGAAIGLLLRSTAAVVGLILGYAVVVEGFIARGISGGRLQPWFVSLNIDAFVENGKDYTVLDCGPNGCNGLQLTNSFTHGWVYLLVLAVIGVLAALLVFRRRDVS